MFFSARAPLQPVCAILAAVSIAILAGCQTKGPAAPVAPKIAEQPPAPHQLSADSPAFLRLANLPADRTPLRVGVILPFSNASAATRALAQAMLNAAELALYDSGNKDIVLITADDSANSSDAATAGEEVLGKGAEIIIGPLFAGSVSAVAPLARDKGVPVLAFSTDKSVAGNGVYLLSFPPQNEIRRVISYALAKGYRNYGALIPANTYGAVSEEAFRDAVTQGGGTIGDVEHFTPGSGAAMDQASALAKANTDAIFIPQGGLVLRGLAPTLAYSGVDTAKVKLLGTGLWDDLSVTREVALKDGWFAAPAPDADDALEGRYRAAFGGDMPTLAALSYDAVSLVALLAPGKPYHRFTQAALTDPNGFEGVDGIFRFNADGSIERGLAILAVRPDGFDVVDPAPTTFQTKASPSQAKIN